MYDSPPPCGAGLGVGVAAALFPNELTPVPPSVALPRDTSPARGEDCKPRNGCAQVYWLNPSTSRVDQRATFAAFRTSSANFSATTKRSPTFTHGSNAKSGSISSTVYSAYLILGEYEIARLPGMVQGVVVQMITLAPTSDGPPNTLSREASLALMIGNFTQIGYALAGTQNRYAYRVGPGTTVNVDLLLPGVGIDMGQNPIVPSGIAAVPIPGFTAVATANLDGDLVVDAWHVNDIKQNLQSADQNDAR